MALKINGLVSDWVEESIKTESLFEFPNLKTQHGFGCNLVFDQECLIDTKGKQRD